MIIREVKITKFRAFEDVNLQIGKRLTAIVGRNACMKTTLLGILSQPFSISKESGMCGEKTLDGYDYRSQLKEKFKLSPEHDIPGEHTWTLYFRNKEFYNGKEYIEIKSVVRKANNRPDTLRFINADQGKKKGHGYVQIPVIFLSLTRLFPIGESGKTTTVNLDLSQEEKKLYIKWYKEILSLHYINNPIVAMERKDSKRVFSGIIDDTHNIDASSAGEGNIGRIIIAILSFMRLQDKHKDSYKGGILLIDEIDATLHGFSQRKVIEFLSRKAKDLNLQIIFTTHSPNILKTVNEIQRKEVRDKRIKDCNRYEYDNQIIHLQSDYNDNGKRLIVGNNITSAAQLQIALNDMEMKSTFINQNIHLYTEDERSNALLGRIFHYKDIELSKYVKHIEVNLGWTNYCQLISKEVPEFLSSMIVLDKDVENKKTNPEQRQAMALDTVLCMPIDVERGLFEFIKKYDKFNKFRNILKEKQCELTYEICFSEWPEDNYDTGELKRWFKNLENSIPDLNILYDFWCTENESEIEQFVDLFKKGYNKIAQEEGLDFMI